MNGTAATAQTNLAWTVSHVADFNGNGKADLLWRNTTDGSFMMWLMAGTALTSGTGLLGASPWSVVPTTP
jgi:hypothetical protein